MKTDENADDLVEGILREIEQLETTANIAGLIEPEAGAADLGKGSAKFLHVHDGGVPGQNPAFAEGVEFARLGAEHKLDDLDPVPFLSLPEMEKDGAIAVRDSRKKTDLVPGENLYSRSVGETECYHAKVRGRVLVIGKTIHILPSDVDGKMLARVDPGRLSASLDLHPSFGKGRMPDLPAVLAFLDKNDIRFGINEPSILEAIGKCVSGRKAVKGFQIARGTPTVAGRVGSIEYFFDRDFQGPVLPDLEVQGKIDYRDVKWVPVVVKDQLLARVSPGIPATDGMDVSGRVLTAKPIARTYLVPGHNVRTEKDETEFYSTISGCVQLNGTLIDVMNVFVVNSDVDFHTGNVRFEGNILITGTVRKGFEVEAEGDVVVLVNAEPSRIKAGRDIRIKGGVLGAGKGKYGLEAGRDITAGYAENALLEAHGDISIENFSMQSFLYCSGRIFLERKRGSLVGGEAMAAKGVEAKALGSPSGIKTFVAAGIDFALRRKQASLTGQAGQLQEAAAKIDGFLRSLLDLSRRGALPPSKAQSLKEILEKRKLISKAAAATSVRLQELAWQQVNLEPGRVKASEIAYPEVCVAIRGHTYRISEPCIRAIFRLDDKTDQIIRGPA